MALELRSRVSGKRTCQRHSHQRAGTLPAAAAMSVCGWCFFLLVPAAAGSIEVKNLPGAPPQCFRTFTGYLPAAAGSKQLFHWSVNNILIHFD